MNRFLNSYLILVVKIYTYECTSLEGTLFLFLQRFHLLFYLLVICWFFPPVKQLFILNIFQICPWNLTHLALQPSCHVCWTTILRIFYSMVDNFAVFVCCHYLYLLIHLVKNYTNMYISDLYLECVKL